MRPLISGKTYLNVVKVIVKTINENINVSIYPFKQVFLSFH